MLGAIRGCRGVRGELEADGECKGSEASKGIRSSGALGAPRGCRGIMTLGPSGHWGHQRCRG